MNEKPNRAIWTGAERSSHLVEYIGRSLRGSLLGEEDPAVVAGECED